MRLGASKWPEYRQYRQHKRTPNSSASPVILARNSSSSVGTGVASGDNSDPGSRTIESDSTRVKEESNDSVESQDFCTSSKLEAEHSNVVPSPKEANASVDWVGLVKVCPSVILGVFLEETPIA
jgi:hypothetical protein